MEDVSEVFKRHFNLLHKGTAITKTVQDRKESHNIARKAKRDTLAYLRRNINDDLSPIITPTPRKNGSRRNKNKIENTDDLPEKNIQGSTKIRSKRDGVNKRLEQLRKWKAEKEKLKVQEKAKAKPIFKVYHVPSELTADLENANKVIKGKPIVPGSSSKKSQFAPPNYKFKPPQGVKPLNFNTSVTQTQSSINKLNKLTPQKKARNDTILKKTLPENSSNSLKGSSRQESSRLRPNLSSRETNDNNLKPDNKKNIKENKPEVRKLKEDKTDGLIEEVKKKAVALSDITKISKNNNKAGTSNTNKNTRKTRVEKTTNPKMLLPNSPRKAVGWKARKSDLTKNFSDSDTTSKITYRKTPKKSNVLENDPGTSNTNKNTRKTHVEKTINPKMSVPNSPKKAVGWKARKSDLNKSSSDSDTTSKITYRKTPKKSSVVENDQREFGINRSNVSVDVIRDDPNEEILKSTDDDSNNKPKSNDNVLDSDGSQLSSQRVNNHMSVSGSSVSTDYSVNYETCSTTGPSTTSVSDYKTPPPVYVSPFVTISRGKDSARKEYKIRTSQGKCDFDQDTPEVKKILTAHTSPKAGAAYFRRKLDIEIERINCICSNWESYLQNPDLPEEAYSSIDVAIGQSKLLISKKFKQFRSLIYQCETENYEAKAVTCEDLHGFWDMVYMQVEDLDKRFANLHRLKDNNWQEILPQKVEPVKRPRGRPKKVQTKSKLMQMIQDARKKQKQQPAEEVFISGLDNPTFLPITPSKDKVIEEEPGSIKRSSLRVSVLSRGNKSRCSSSPGLTMMKISQSIKQGDGLTPARSILKSDVYRSTGKKSVVFKDFDASPRPLCKTNLFDEQEKENISDNLINFSPTPLTPRRSARISKLQM